LWFSHNVTIENQH